MSTAGNSKDRQDAAEHSGRHARTRRGRERLVQPRGGGHLRRHGRGFRYRHLRRKLLRRPGLSDGVRSRQLHGQGRQHEQRRVLAFVRLTLPTPTAAASRAPDANGWYNRALTISFAQAPGELSGLGRAARRSPTAAPIPAPRPSQDRAPTELGTQRTGGACVQVRRNAAVRLWRAGGSPDANGWYNDAVALALTRTDATSASAPCGGPSYPGPDGRRGR